MSHSKCSKSTNDCFYYFYMNCAKGKVCPYRHCAAAKRSVVTCDDWRNNDCKARDCPKRHMESVNAQFKILCKFEMNRNSGCTKDNCDFLHRNPNKVPITRKAQKTISDLKSKVKQLEKKLNEMTVNSGQSNSSEEQDSDHNEREDDDLAATRVVHLKTYICGVCDANSRKSFRKFIILDDCQHVICGTCYRNSITAGNNRCLRCDAYVRSYTSVN